MCRWAVIANLFTEINIKISTFYLFTSCILPQAGLICDMRIMSGMVVWKRLWNVIGYLYREANSIYCLICLCQTHFSQNYICIFILIGQYIVCIRQSASSGMLEVISFALGYCNCFMHLLVYAHRLEIHQNCFCKICLECIFKRLGYLQFVYMYLMSDFLTQAFGKWMALACLEFISQILIKLVGWTRMSLKTAGEEKTGSCWTGN